MAKSMRPQLALPRTAPTLDAVQSAGGGFFWDQDAYHIMEERDNALIEEELLHGPLSSRFLYRFTMADGTDVAGISVVGARHLASAYGGLRHRIVASIHKTGSLFVFRTYPSEGIPMQVTSAQLFDLLDEPDYYSVLAEMSDIKLGNTIQIEFLETKEGKKRSGGNFVKPNYPTLAQSKAYRNGVLALIPQTLLIKWKEEMMKLGKDVIITGSVLEEKRSAVLRFATARGLIVDRRAVEELVMDQIDGLRDAAREEDAAAFVVAARSVGLQIEQDEQHQESAAALKQAEATKPTTGGKRTPAKPAAGTPEFPKNETDDKRSPAAEPSDDQQPQTQEGAANAGTPAPAAGGAAKAPEGVICSAPTGKCRYAGCQDAGRCLAAPASGTKEPAAAKPAEATPAPPATDPRPARIVRDLLS